MNEGLHYLPLVQTRRDKLAEDGNHYSKEFLDCEVCERNTSGNQRLSMRCGWRPESEWLWNSGPYPEAECCPGYTMRLADVHEAARAYSWSQRGELNLLYDDKPTPLLRSCVDYLTVGVRNAEREYMREQRKEMKHRG